MVVYFFDSSALVKRHVNETGSVWVRSLSGIKAGNTLNIARITSVEITSAITRRQRGRYLSAAQAGAMVSADSALNDAAIAERLPVENPNLHP